MKDQDKNALIKHIEVLKYSIKITTTLVNKIMLEETLLKYEEKLKTLNS